MVSPLSAELGRPQPWCRRPPPESPVAPTPKKKCKKGFKKKKVKGKVKCVKKKKKK